MRRVGCLGKAKVTEDYGSCEERDTILRLFERFFASQVF